MLMIVLQIFFIIKDDAIYLSKYIDDIKNGF